MSDWSKAVEKARERERERERDQDPRLEASEEAPLLTSNAQAPL